ncbi:wax ester/triacylglycerol synthase family O-acyltransferase [Mycobacterium montefiorense]
MGRHLNRPEVALPMGFLMSPADALFLIAERPQRPLHVGSVALLGPPEDAKGCHLRDMVTAALARERAAPEWRLRPHRSLRSLGQWHWRTDPEIDLSYHVRISALPAPGGLTELWDLVSRLHSELLDRTRPLWQFHLIEGLDDQRCAAYIKTHPALLARVSLARLVQQIVGTDPNRRGMPAFWETAEQTGPHSLTPPVGGSDWLDTIQATWVMPKMLAGDGLRNAARGALAAVAGMAGMALPLADTTWRAACRRGGPLTLAAPRSPLNVPISGNRAFAGCSFSIERLQRVAARTDATIDDVVLAMCAGALRQYLTTRNALPSMPLVAMVPIVVPGNHPADRTNPDTDSKLGLLMCSLATHLANPAERLQAVCEGMREGFTALAARSQTQVLAMSVLGATPLALAITLGRPITLLHPPNVMICNLFGLRGPLYWNGARLEALYPLSVPVSGQALNISYTRIDNQLTFGLTACRSAVPAINSLADLLGRELEILDTASRFRIRRQIN